MKKSSENKAITPKEAKTKFFYPEHQMTIEAETKEVADKKLEKLLEKK
jgi:hypothetical protein